MSVTTYVKFNGNQKKKVEVPLTLDWQNARMVRHHSIIAVTREILSLIMALDVVKINIIGTPSTGKTALAECLAHLGHKLAKIPFTVKIFSRKELLDFENTLSKLQPTNYIFIFDDISFLSAGSSGKQIKKIEQAFTEIRHLPGGQDVKIIVIFNFHYNMAISKYMRQSDFFFYTSVGSSELENTQKILGNKNTKKIVDFKKYYLDSVTTGKFDFALGKKGQKHTYEYRKPFAPVLFFNGNVARTVVYPLRKWIDPQCSMCSSSAYQEVKESGDIEKLDENLKTEFKPLIINQAMKIKLFNMGVNVYAKPVKRCMAAIEKALSNEAFDIEALATHYNLVDKQTRYDPKDSEIEGNFITGIG